MDVLEPFKLPKKKSGVMSGILDSIHPAYDFGRPAQGSDCMWHPKTPYTSQGWAYMVSLRMNLHSRMMMLVKTL